MHEQFVIVSEERDEFADRPAGERLTDLREGRALFKALVARAGAFPEGMAAAELAVHTYDLTKALDRATARLDPEIGEVGHAFMSSATTDDMRGDAFAPEQPSPADSDAYERSAPRLPRHVRLSHQAPSAGVELPHQRQHAQATRFS